tara:strand:+ start:181 stop:543 length:363 start_codon:yes stop_codon:yes gene_type:complete
MIDMSKYEGHIEGPWGLYCFGDCEKPNTHEWVIASICPLESPDLYIMNMFRTTKSNSDYLYNKYGPSWYLMRDAPLILQALIDERAEVKRLREENERLRDMVEKANGYGSYDKEYEGDEQ